MRFIETYWLPESPNWRDDCDVAGRSDPPSWNDFVLLANARLSFLQTNKLDKTLAKAFESNAPSVATGKPVRLAVLSSATTDHLLSGLRVAALRRGMSLQAHLGDFGQYRQELMDASSALHAFKPNVVLFAFDAHHLVGDAAIGMNAKDADAFVEATLASIRDLWRRAAAAFAPQIIQQAILPIVPTLCGSNEHRLRGSPAWLVARLNQRTREIADQEGVDMLALDDRAARDGIAAWHDPVLWHRGKQEVSPAAAPAYGELAVRLVAARQGRSAKCLVLDLDNTLWGGVIGDDGLDGIRLGQGSAEGEAFVGFQRYARDLSRRGVILAVCSKNDEANAFAAFDKHPEMVLRRSDIACFVANWDDKAKNIHEIADRLNIGIDSLVFADDNPFERNIIRRELPMVAVPELPEDPALYAQCLADAGYFEAVQITTEDLERSGQYQANIARQSLRGHHTDMAGYLASLDMVLRWAPFDPVGLQRIVQLINKTNQFNLTTRRYNELDVLAVMADPRAMTLQLRLIDRFSDNGIIGLVIGKPDREALWLDIWLMSCRVLGRQVEEATLNLVVQEAKKLGFQQLVGEYLPTGKNGMVRDLYRKLGFVAEAEAEDGAARWRLALSDHSPFPTSIATVKA